MGYFNFENQGNQTYLIYGVQEGDLIDSLSMGMLNGNHIPGFARTSYTQRDLEKFILYNITAQIPASQILSGTVKRNRLLKLLEGIATALLSAEDYMLRQESILLDLNYIFVDVAMGESALICLPLENLPPAVEPRAFFKEVMFDAQFDQTENCSYVPAILNYINSDPTFSLSGFQELIRSLNAQEETPLQIAWPKQVSPDPQPLAAPDPPTPYVPPIQQQQDPPVQVSVKQSVPLGMERPKFEQDQGEKQLAASPTEKGMSLAYLLQHYNKENAAIYKAQKEAKKTGAAPKSNQKSNKKTLAPYIPGGVKIPDNHMNGVPFPYTPPQSQAQDTSSQNRAHLPPLEAEQLSTLKQPAFNAASARNMEFKEKNGDFGDTSYFYDEEDSGTSFLDDDPMVNSNRIRPHLIRRKNGENIPLAKPVFRIGRDSSYNDYAITDNKYIGSSHCHIITRNNEYFIIDSNSKNHTYVDGMMVQSGTEVKLSHGQTVRLANEEFEFDLY